MSYFKFAPNDVFYNRIETHPQNDFLLWNTRVYYNYKGAYTGTLSGQPVNHVPVGNISLYELNVDRPSDSMIYPFITKDGSLTSFKTISTTNFNCDFSYGDVISGTYPLNAGISRDYVLEGAPFHTGAAASLCPPYGICKKHLVALENTLNYYRYLSPHYAYSSPLGDKGEQRMSLVFVPSIFYGSSIEKGSINLKYFVTGTLIGELQDTNRNGELIEVTGPNTGSVAGVALYNEGILLLTGSWDLSTHTERYIPEAVSFENASWLYFASTGSTSIAPVNNVPSSSFAMSFRGTSYVSVQTMLAHARKGKLNYSNNPTYVEYGQSGSLPSAITGTTAGFHESPNRRIKNTVATPYADPVGSFAKQTWISRVGVYDKDRNLIGVAKLANPVKKTEEREFTFKLKLDI